MTFPGNVRIVLVQPEHPGNVGSAARAMQTMGLSDLVLVAQIIGQTSTIDRLGEIGGQGDIPPGAESPARAVISGEIQLPDLFVMWTPEGWYVNANPDFQIQSQHCRTKEELSSILQQLAEVCASHRIS